MTEIITPELLAAREGYEIVRVTVLARKHDSEEVVAGFRNVIEHDASLGGWVSEDELTADDLADWGETIRDDRDEEDE